MTFTSLLQLKTRQLTYFTKRIHKKRNLCVLKFRRQVLSLFCFLLIFSCEHLSELLLKYFYGSARLSESVFVASGIFLLKQFTLAGVIYVQINQQKSVKLRRVYSSLSSRSAGSNPLMGSQFPNLLSMYLAYEGKCLVEYKL